MTITTDFPSSDLSRYLTNDEPWDLLQEEMRIVDAEQWCVDQGIYTNVGDNKYALSLTVSKAFYLWGGWTNLEKAAFAKLCEDINYHSLAQGLQTNDHDLVEEYLSH